MSIQRYLYVCIGIVMIGTMGADIFCVKGRPQRILLDTDVDTDDLFALLYLLKLNRSEFDLQAITINTNAWTDAGHAVNQVYDVLHMMGRDDIAVGVGGEGAILEDGTIMQNVGGYLPIIEQGNDTAGYCRYRQAIPVGPGGRLDIDTNYGFQKSFLPQDILIVGGHINNDKSDKGNVINIPSNEYAELNMFLDPLAAKMVFDSGLNITLIPLSIQQKVSRFQKVLERLDLTKTTPEALFARRLISRLQRLKQTHPRYQHTDKFLGEILGAVIMAGDQFALKTTYVTRPVSVLATGIESEDGQITIDQDQGNSVKVLENVDQDAYYDIFANRLRDEKQSAIVGSFEEQRRIWNTPRS